MPITGMELEGVTTEGTVRPELLVKKRNGDVVSFDANRIQDAVRRCLVLDCGYAEDEAQSISDVTALQVYNLVQLQPQPVGVEEDRKSVV